jgi:hypothetical protein
LAPNVSICSGGIVDGINGVHTGLWFDRIHSDTFEMTINRDQFELSPAAFRLSSIGMDASNCDASTYHRSFTCRINCG